MAESGCFETLSVLQYEYDICEYIQYMSEKANNLFKTTEDVGPPGGYHISQIGLIHLSSKQTSLSSPAFAVT